MTVCRYVFCVPFFTHAPVYCKCAWPFSVCADVEALYCVEWLAIRLKGFGYDRLRSTVGSWVFVYLFVFYLVLLNCFSVPCVPDFPNWLRFGVCSFSFLFFCSWKSNLIGHFWTFGFSVLSVHSSFYLSIIIDLLPFLSLVSFFCTYFRPFPFLCSLSSHIHRVKTSILAPGLNFGIVSSGDHVEDILQSARQSKGRGRVLCWRSAVLHSVTPPPAILTSLFYTLFSHLSASTLHMPPSSRVFIAVGTQHRRFD